MGILTYLSLFQIAIIIDGASESNRNRHERSPIISGRNAPIAQYRFFVALEFRSESVCGGSIISHYLALTAAHCFDDSNKTEDYLLRAGSEFELEGGVEYPLLELQIHKKYAYDSEGGVINDIAITIVAESFNFEIFRPIRLIPADDKVAPNTKATILGFSMRKQSTPKGILSRHLSETRVWIVEREKCNAIWMQLDKVPIPENVICADGRISGGNVCGGDSGGPLIVDGLLAGITSFGHQRCRKRGIPSIYTDISKFRGWIDEKKRVLKRPQRSIRMGLGMGKDCHREAVIW